MAFDDKVLFENFSYHPDTYDRIGIIGKNGSGKTTLLKLLLNKAGLKRFFLF